MVVIQDQPDLVVGGLGGELIDQRRHQRLKRGRCRRAEQRAHPLFDSRVRPVQRGYRMPPEPGRVVVGRVQREPPGRAATVSDPVGQQDCLAVSGRGAHQDQPLRQPLIEPLRQPRPGHLARPRPRHMQFGRQQHIPPARAGPRSGRRGRLSHRDPHAHRLQSSVVRCSAHRNSRPVSGPAGTRSRARPWGLAAAVTAVAAVITLIVVSVLATMGNNPRGGPASPGTSASHQTRDCHPQRTAGISAP